MYSTKCFKEVQCNILETRNKKSILSIEVIIAVGSVFRKILCNCYIGWLAGLEKS